MACCRTSLNTVLIAFLCCLLFLSCWLLLRLHQVSAWHLQIPHRGCCPHAHNNAMRGWGSLPRRRIGRIRCRRIGGWIGWGDCEARLLLLVHNAEEDVEFEEDFVSFIEIYVLFLTFLYKEWIFSPCSIVCIWVAKYIVCCEHVKFRFYHWMICNIFPTVCTLEFSEFKYIYSESIVCSFLICAKSRQGIHFFLLHRHL